MSKKIIMNSSYKIKRFLSSNERDFISALKIYNDTIPVETKTSTNEIVYFIDNRSTPNREMYFFGLYYNEEIVGYIECAYLFKTKSIIIDYITLKDSFNINGIFYPLFSLFQQYFSDNLIDYDYIITEISVRTLSENVDRESYYARKLLRAEDFRIVDVPYYQPLLGISNYESNFDLRLMIKSIGCVNSLKKETLLGIVNDIYYNHYVDWYNHFLNDSEIEEYKNHITAQYDKFEKSLSGIDSIVLQDSFLGICDHYCTNDCYYYNSEISTAGFAKNKRMGKRRLVWILGIPLIITVSVVLAFLIHILLKKFSISSDEIAPYFAAISATLTGIIGLIFSTKSRK